MNSLDLCGIILKINRDLSLKKNQKRIKLKCLKNKIENRWFLSGLCKRSTFHDLCLFLKSKTCLT